MIRITSYLRNVYRRGVGWLPTGLLGVGMMLAASCSSGTPVTPDGPDSGPEIGLTVSGSNNRFVVVGPQGGPFPNGSRDFEVTNASNQTLEWVAQSSEPWLRFSDTGGTLLPGRTATVTVTLDGDTAATLPPGEHPADIVFRQPGAPDAVFVSFLLVVRPTSSGALMVVNPPGAYNAEGQVGGSITPDGKTYTIMNSGDEPMEWVARANQQWIRISDPHEGTLQAGAAATVIVSISPSAANNLGQGFYQGDVNFLNLTNGFGDTSRPVSLTLEDATSSDGRVTDGLVTLYAFEEAGGNQIYDISGISPSMDLQVADLDSTQWIPGGISINSPTILQSAGPASKLIDACRQTNEVTAEIWIVPDNLNQDGPARIMTISAGSTRRNLTLGQGLWGEQASDGYNTRLRTTATDLDGMPLLDAGAGTASLQLTHLVYTRAADGTARMYVNGEQKAETFVDGNLSNWDESYAIAFGNEIGAFRPWLGELHLAAVYARALEPGEVQQNFAAGTGDAGVGHLAVTPFDGFEPTGRVGGSFSSTTKVYTLTNTGVEVVDWQVGTSAPWAMLTGASSGTLFPGETSEVTVELDLSAAQGYDVGTYNSDLVFENLTNGFGNTSRNMRLTVLPQGGGGGGNPGGGGSGELVNSITQYGITWTFDGLYEAGQYVTGDYWVVGPVRVVSVSPSPSGGRNGSMINPGDEPQYGQAYDSRAVQYRASNGVSYPVDLNPDHSLVSTISNSSTPVDDLIGTRPSFGFLKTAAVLTVVSEAQSSTNFRPPLAGPQKPVYDSADLRWHLLPNLARTSGSPSYMPDGIGPVEQYTRYFKRPWLLHQNDWHGRQIHPTDNMPGYHREVYNTIADASLMLVSDFPNKEELVIGFIQTGIDMSKGVDSSIHKWNIIFAGLMLGDSALANTNYNARTDWMSYYANQGTSGYSSSTVPANQGWTGATVLWRQDPGNPEHEHLHPTEWAVVANGGGINREQYRRLNSYTWPAAALAAMSMNARGNWGHNAFFDYVDRWMTEPDAANMAYVEDLWNTNVWIQGGSTGSQWQSNMWSAHRDDF